MTERRFTDEEAAQIFARAAEPERPGRSLTAPGEASRDGMTLAQLQEIAREVGIAPELVAQAARSLEAPPKPARRFLGFPIGVGRTVDLGRRFTEEEWERLVVDLRDTFDARGTVRSDGSFRQWTNGNLQALLEPTPSGHQLRLRTTNGVATRLMRVGVALTGMAGVMSLISVLGSHGPGRLVGAAFLAITGAGVFLAGALRLPAWARRRQEQMGALAARHALAAGEAPPGGRSPLDPGSSPQIVDSQ